jgi:hypothetical protein
MGLIYILITTQKYKDKCAYQCLEEWQRSFTQQWGNIATTAKSESLTSRCNNVMSVMMQKFNNLENADKLSHITRKVEAVKAVMQDNIDVSLKNCVKLENIERQAEDLQMQCHVFKKGAGDLKNKMRCKEIRMKIIIGFIVLAVIGGIVGVVAWQSKKNTSS